MYRRTKTKRDTGVRMKRRNKMNTTEKAYKAILKALNKYKSEIVFDVDDLERKAKHHLFGIDLVEKYGFNLDPKTIYSTDWQKLKENVHIGFF